MYILFVFTHNYEYMHGMPNTDIVSAHSVAFSFYTYRSAIPKAGWKAKQLIEKERREKETKNERIA